MKLRISGNSLRLRLTGGEARRFAASGRITETIRFGLEPNQRLIYELRAAADAENIFARFQSGRITIFVPMNTAREWATSERIGIAAEQRFAADKSLRISIEKDFADLNS